MIYFSIGFPPSFSGGFHLIRQLFSVTSDIMSGPLGGDGTSEIDKREYIKFQQNYSVGFEILP